MPDNNEYEYDYVINTLSKPHYNSKKLTVTGTGYDDLIDYSESGYYPKGKTNIKKKKGLTINAGGGNDTITGTEFNDIIKGGAGSDIIKGGAGNDKLYGTSGENTFVFNDGDGKDVIYTSKGADTLCFENFDNFEQFIDNVILSSKGKSLVIKYTDGDSVTISNYFKKTSVKKILIVDELRDLEEVISEYSSTRIR